MKDVEFNFQQCSILSQLNILQCFLLPKNPSYTQVKLPIKNLLDLFGS